MMGTFEKALRAHDWYYAYSDDHRYWARGQKTIAELRIQHKALECPYDFAELRQYVHDMVVDLFAEEVPGEWYRQPKKYKNMAPVKENDLLTRTQFDNIAAWLEENDR